MTADGAITTVRREWANVASGADLVLTIGVRAVLDDVHIWDPILNTSAEIWFVGGEGGDFSALSARVGKRLTTIAPRFDEAVPSIRRRLARMM
jgi:hypothetical protein